MHAVLRMGTHAKGATWSCLSSSLPARQVKTTPTLTQESDAYSCIAIEKGRIACYNQFAVASRILDSSIPSPPHHAFACCAESLSPISPNFFSPSLKESGKSWIDRWQALQTTKRFLPNVPLRSHYCRKRRFEKSSALSSPPLSQQRK